MRFAIVSDIHGNIKAYEVLKKYLKANNIDIALNLGDIMGGMYPSELLKKVIEDSLLISVAGNHDIEYLKLGLEISNEQREYLQKLPLSRVIEIEGIKFLMVHSKKDSNKEIPILYNEGKLIEFLNDYDGEWDYVLFGHTHYQCLLSFYEGKTLVNPGSLGLSYDGKISFAIGEINENEVNFKFIKLDGTEME